MKRQLIAMALAAMIAWVPPVRTLFLSLVTVASQVVSHWLIQAITHAVAK